MSVSATGIISNTGEDFVDEYISALVYRESNSYIKDIKTQLDLQEGDILDEAIDSALTTFQYGVMNATIMIITEYAITKSGLILMGLIAYVKGRSFVKKGRAVAQNIFQKIGSKGGFVGKAIQGAFGAVVGSQEQTLAIAKMTNDSANNLVTNVSMERQNQILLRTQKLQRVDATKANLYSVRNKARDKNMSLFMWKTTNGQWEKTQKDEKLFEDCSGSKVPFNADFVAKLNSLADVVKTAKGEIISRAKAEIDMITAIGANVKG